MIISRSPFRISFFGGGSDHPEWFNDNEGLVISTTINKYDYILFNRTGDSNKNMIYSKKIYSFNRNEEISNFFFKRIVDTLFYNHKPLNILHHSDLLGRSGIGSSAAFLANLHKISYFLNNFDINKKELSLKVFNFEKNILKECTGLQDQVATSYGGFNKIYFSKNKIKVSPIKISAEQKDLFSNWIQLFYTDKQRSSSKISINTVKGFKSNSSIILEMVEICKQSEKLFKKIDTNNLIEIGKLLDLSWNLKRRLSKMISNSKIDEMILKAKSVGSIGGKILGAGGGGFLMLITPPEKKLDVEKALRSKSITIKLTNTGTKLISF